MNPGPKSIGFEDNSSWRSKRAFSKVNDIYGDDLLSSQSEQKEGRIPANKLTNIDKLKIRDRIKEESKQERKKEIFIGIVLIAIAFGIFALYSYLK